MTGEMLLPEMTGGGGAFLDVNGDGRLDLFLVQGRELPGLPERSEPIHTRPAEPLRDRLYLNLAGPGDVVRLVEATEAAALVSDGYGMAVAAGDVDGDGRVDLYVANLGPNQLWLNRGDHFEDATEGAGVGDPAWSAGASFFDADRDGDLDLWVVNYVDFPMDDPPDCWAPSSRRDYCGPGAFPPVADRFYRNRGDGTFEDASRKVGIAGTAGPGLGVVAFDADGDGWQDVFVANDGAPNFLWINDQKGGFREDALFAGVALNGQGRPEASMGIVLADLDGRGGLDLLLAHLAGETNTLYLTEGGGVFRDATLASGLGPPSLPRTAFGISASDVDGDGILDVVVANGAVRILEGQAAAGMVHPLGEPGQFYRGLGQARFREEFVGDDLARFGVGRGLATGDVDGDGDEDFLMIENGGPARLLVNDRQPGHDWIGIDLGGRPGRVEGATVLLRLDDGTSRQRRHGRDGSWGSARSPTVIESLPPGVDVWEVVVTWTDGVVEACMAPARGRRWQLERGFAGAAP